MRGAQAAAARELAERRFEHPLISAFLDLDPTRFATAAARATEANSLLDQAQQKLTAELLEHDDRAALEHDVDRLGRYLTSELDAAGAAAVAIYCSSRSSLFQAMRLPRSVPSGIVIEPLPWLEPLLPAPVPTSLCVTLVNRREARFFLRKEISELSEYRFEDPVHGQHKQGGWSYANYERSIEADVNAHLRRCAARLYELWRLEHFERLVLGGPHEVVARFTPELHADLRAVLDDQELALDVGTSSAADVDAALEPLRRRWRNGAQEQALQRLLSTLDVRGGTSIGIPDTLAALGRRQIRSLVLAARTDAQGGECPQCGQLYAVPEQRCAADGVQLVPLRSLRSGMIRAAIRQDAEVIVLDELDRRPEVAAFDGVGAILRY